MVVADLTQNWQTRLCLDSPEQSAATRDSIIRWLLGNDLEQFETLNPVQLKIAQQAMEYRHRILQARYLGLGPERAYRNLTTRLGSVMLVRNKIRTWVALSRDRQRAVVDVLQEIIQELLTSDRYMKQQITWIAECTSDPRLRNALLFASIEEYCLRPIRNQPLLVYRFVNYLRRMQRGGLTQVPTDNLLQFVSEDFHTEDNENPINLVDMQAIANHQDMLTLIEQQDLRTTVKQEFSSYLEKHLGAVAVKWFELYLQGQSQDTISRSLRLPVKDIYRLREKVSYHALRVFALKAQPELVYNWLGRALR